MPDVLLNTSPLQEYINDSLCTFTTLELVYCSGSSNVILITHDALFCLKGPCPVLLICCACVQSFITRKKASLPCAYSNLAVYPSGACLNAKVITAFFISNISQTFLESRLSHPFAGNLLKLRQKLLVFLLCLLKLPHFRSQFKAWVVFQLKSSHERKSVYQQRTVLSGKEKL